MVVKSNKISPSSTTMEGDDGRSKHRIPPSSSLPLRIAFSLPTAIVVVLFVVAACWGGFSLGREYAIRQHQRHQRHHHQKQSHVDTESNFAPSMDKISESVREERMQHLLSSTASASNSTVSVGNKDDPRTVAAVAASLVHPALLAHPNPHRILILTAQDENMSILSSLQEAYLQMAMKHDAVNHIDLILLRDDDDPEEEEDDDNNNIYDFQERMLDYDGVTVQLHPMSSKEFDHLLSEIEKGDKNPFHPDVLFIDARVTPYVLAEETANWYEVLQPLRCWVEAPKMEDLMDMDECQSMAIWELSGISKSPITSTFRYELVDILTSGEDTSAMSDFDVWVDGVGHRNYVLAVRYDVTLALWHRNEAEWNRILVDDVNRTRVDLETDLWLDSPSMKQLEYPSKYSEVEYCRRHPTDYCCPIGGSGFDNSRINVRLDQLKVQQSQQGEHAGRGVFTTVPLSIGMYIGAESQDLVRATWPNMQLINGFLDHEDSDLFGTGADQLHSYLHGYGYELSPFGRPQVDVDSSLMLFVNHGCNGTYNINFYSDYHEASVELPPDELVAKAENESLSVAEELYLYELMPKDYRDLAGETSGIYSPIRHDVGTSASKVVANVEANQELLDNYMPYGGLVGATFWPFVKSLKDECQGVAGFIEQYQDAAAATVEKPEKSSSYDKSEL